jgi:hypothetical protein
MSLVASLQPSALTGFAALPLPVAELRRRTKHLPRQAKCRLPLRHARQPAAMRRDPKAKQNAISFE